MKSKTKLAEKIKYHNWTPDILVFFSYINRQGSTNCFKQCGIHCILYGISSRESADINVHFACVPLSSLLQK